MASVGINFGSATGGAGFDVAATVTAILAISQGVETPWKSQLTSFSAQDAALTGLGTDLASLATAVSSLTDFAGVLASKQGSSSNTGVVALASASAAAVAGSHSVTVSSLARTSSTSSGQIANAGDTLSGSLSIQVGSGGAQTITLDSSNNTLGGLAAAINLGAYGVTASVVTDTTGSGLALTSQTGGAAGQITLTPSLTDTTTGAGVSFSTGTTGADAALTVDGINTTSASNTVTGAIPGVSFQLLAASAEPVQIVIANNNSAVEGAVGNLVSAYNAVVGALKTQEGKDASGNAEPLYGSPTLALIQQQLSSSLLGGGSSGGIHNIGQLGLQLQLDGTLTLSTTTLESALNSNFSDVKGFLQNTGSFGQTFQTAINSLGQSSSTGAVALALAENSSQEAGIGSSITNEDALIAAQKINLTTELNTANQILQSIPAQLNSFNEIYSAISGYSRTNG